MGTEDFLGGLGVVGGNTNGRRWTCVCGQGGISATEAMAPLDLYHHRISRHTEQPKPPKPGSMRGPKSQFVILDEVPDA